MNLLEFQRKAINKIKTHFLLLDDKKILLQSPTGSGKTIIALNVIKELNSVLGDIIFLWIAPGTGFLHKQSFEKAKHVSGVNPNLIEGELFDFVNKNTYFINWEKINKINNIYNMTMGDAITWTSSIRRAKIDKKIFLIIDEEHLAHSDKSNEIIGSISPDFLLRLSATPKNGEVDAKVEVSIQDVISEGLIRDEVIINDYLEKGQLFNDRVALKFGIQKLNELSSTYKIEGYDEISPLMLVQIPNGIDSKFLESLITDLVKMGVHKEKIAIWLSEEKINLNSIDLMDVLIFKNAIAVGWDYPRAQILVKLREVGSKAFHIQTLGRIRRNIAGRPFIHTSLNKGYLFTTDNKLMSEAIKHGNGKEVVYSIIKDEYRNLKVPKAEFRRRASGDFFNSIHNSIINYAKTVNFNDFSLGGIRNQTMIGTDKHISFIDTITPIEKDEIKRLFWRNVTNIGVKTKQLNYEMTNSILRSLFHANSDGIIKKLDTLSYYKYVNENIDAITDIFVSSVENTKEVIFENSHNQNMPVVQKNTVNKDFELAKKSIYNNYPRQLHDSLIEEKLINFLEDTSFFDAWFKNTTSIDSPINVVYKVAQEYKNFKPDFLLIKNNKIIIAEVKGESDIDKNTLFKYNFAKEFFDNLNIKFILIRERKSSIVFWDGDEYEDDLLKYKKLGDFDEQ